MIYVVSDIHGSYDKYQELLKTIHFEAEDILYVLGDVIDRGLDGFQILLDMAKRSNVVGLLGNHEAMAIDALPGILRAIRQGTEETLTEEEEEAAELWFHNGGAPSLLDFFRLDEKQAQIVWDYMHKMPLYKEIEVGDRQFVLVHGGLERFSPSRPLEDYKRDEILWCRPTPDTVYYQDKYVVFGHTPVQLLCTKNRYAKSPAKIFWSGKSIDIDCGCAHMGGRLGCLCLNTMEEIYIEGE